jgi:phosphoribosyl 1,2-cyclic phosphate phosphodiesterase
MRIEILGSAGALTTPRPGCSCPVCVEARKRGIPYSRTGPSVFVHGPDVLIDTPEESKDQLNRAGIEHVAVGLYSHWHPDHVMGRRVWESLNVDFRAWPPRQRETVDLYLPQQVAEDFKERLGTWEHLVFLEQHNLVRLHVVADGSPIQLGTVKVTPIRLPEDYVYAFIFESPGGRALIVMDEANGWVPPRELGRVDVAVLPLGIHEHDPFTGERRIHEEHPVLVEEATYDETLGIVGALDARRIVLSHIEEMDGLSHDDLVRLGARDGWEPAHDGLIIDLDR